MRAAILAGGMGTRLAEAFPGLPKPMVPLDGKPLLQRQVEALAAQGLRDVTLIVGYRAEAIRAYFGGGEGFGANITYITEERPLGTGGALPLLPREDTLVVFGDLYFELDFQRMAAYHKRKNAAVTLLAHPNSHPYDSDVLVTDGDERVTGWKAKGEPGRGDCRNLVNAGVYLFSAAALPEGAASRRDLERDVIVPLLGGGGVYAYRSTEYVKDIGTPERLAEAERDLLRGIPAARSLRNRQKAVFLDRDGTLNVHDGFITRPEQLRLLPGAAEAVRRLNRSEYLAVCATNQPVIARGDVSFAELDAIHARLDTLLSAEGAYLDDLLFCPHHPDKGFPGERAEYKVACDCRKPGPGLLLRAAERYNIDLARSYMVGDGDADMAAGRAAGCKTLRVGGGTTLLDAVKEILGET